ncbi:hypothetical protein INP83_10935 [Mucilaginibacter sp. 21P]|uniref:hypothetical protein n=1 Tax=Mucilaginibacter sp. 21P TaxID=2778902 RepID=UPI001C5A04C8|nr:hypothetical protein [Mucilaginibacter sp. 21P]QXV63632.1 hypothetical protein INP83_10935 [Mucilaginibacter sp. 21P]
MTQNKLLTFSFKNRRLIARVLLTVWLINLGLPATVYGLTTGPAQPETLAFQPAGVSDMVDLKSGDFKYNVPLMDIDGYPINLSYQSGNGMEDEASWVGFGWTLNTGAINRQLRGVPDDMDGDQVTVEHYTKPSVTVGARLTSKAELFGLASISGSANLSFGVYTNNYTGFGAEFTPNAGISASKFTGGLMTASLGIGLTSDSQKGVDVSPKASLDFSDNITDKMLNVQGLGASLGYNTRSGMKSLSLGASFAPGTVQKLGGGLGTNFSYNTDPINPKISYPYESSSNSFSIDAGAAIFGAFAGYGITGYKTTRSVSTQVFKRPSYGLLYAEDGKRDPDAVMDFIRENDNPIIPETPNLAVPIHTPDMFSYSGQSGTGQFRLFRGGSGVFFDNLTDDRNKSSSDGLDIGGSLNDIHLGVTLFKQDVHNFTRKWTKANSYLANGDFQDKSLNNFNKEHAYFKEVGEMTTQDANLASAMKNTLPVMVQLDASNRAMPNFVGASAQKIEKQSRQPKKTLITYLTADEATHGGLDSVIYNYQMLDKDNLPSVLPSSPTLKKAYPRVDPLKDNNKPIPDQGDYPNVYNDNIYPVRKPRHISEITVTDPSGKRMVYGLPVYNVAHTELSLALGRTYGKIAGTNKTSYPGRGLGIDEYYHRENKAPYASSFLLTAILSPDYVDKTGNGITNDDQGTAVKFNYSKTAYNYNWRAPFDNVNVNRGLLADPDDDKGSVVFGEKELWYINSIETKTKIVYFITEDRSDGVGAFSEESGGPNASQRQRRLSEIRLYSKADMSRPIKTVKFDYDYSLFGAVPNYIAKSGQSATGGKLTLKKVWFEYRNIDRGKYHYYQFNYNPGNTYKDMSTDRWGMFKDAATENLTSALSNEEFPYANQKNRTTANNNAGMWQLNNIKLPTGGDITVNYEADDYTYVQNRKAMAMYAVNGLYKGTGASVIQLNPQTEGALYDMQALGIDLPSGKMPPVGQADLLGWFKRNMLNGSDYLYTKLYVRMKTGNDSQSPEDRAYDYVPCYAKVASVARPASGNYLLVYLENYNAEGLNTNTIMHAALQRLKNEYPRFAYPGFSRKEDGTNATGLMAVLNAVITSIGNLGELFQNFYDTAKGKYATQVDLTKSFLRLAKYDGYINADNQEVIAKTGGGARVKSIYITDNWQPNVASGSNSEVGVYGQAYTYTTTENGKVISSGVASYEPGIGSDENPFKMAIPVIQKIKGGIDNYFDLEEPFGESVFPAPGVTYSKVTIRDLVKTGTNTFAPDPDVKTGYVVNEFYTTKDFPVRTSVLPIDPRRYTPKSYFSFIKTVSDDEMTMSQGYSIELNDMDGKARAVRVYNQGGAQISATEYYYRSTDVGGGSYKLNNNASIVNPDGSVVNAVLGQDIELYGDFREQESINSGTAVNVGSETIIFFVYPSFLPHFPVKLNDDYRLFRSACMLKVVQSYGILDKVVKIQNGSAIATENVAFDGETGDVIISKTQNEFKQPVYTLNIPAYWGYKGMSGGYRSTGIVLQDLTTNASGVLTSYSSSFSPGDEVIDLDVDKQANSHFFGQHYWIVEQVRSGLPTTRYLMDRWGGIQKSFSSKLVKIVRSGNRNMTDADITQIVSLNNPVGANNRLLMTADNDISTVLKAINASATTYDETWATEIPDIHASRSDDDADFGVYQGLRPPISRPFIMHTNDGTFAANEGGYIRSGLDMASISDNPANPLYTNNSGGMLGIIADFYVPETKDYYVAYRSEINLKFSTALNCSRTNWEISNRGTTGKTDVYVYKKQFVKGWNRIHIELSSSETVGADGATGAIEIYNNTFNELRNTYPLTTIFSTRELLSGGGPGRLVYTKTGSDQKLHYAVRYNDYLRTPYDLCSIPKTAINPYVLGYAGNWKPFKTKVFQRNRVYANLTEPLTTAVRVKTTGYIGNFFSNWYYNANAGIQRWMETSATNRWTSASTVTIYDRYGQQLENQDALGRFSAAKFDFNGELPAAVASNARNRELYANSFEDGKFTFGLPVYYDPTTPAKEFTSNGNYPSLGSIITGDVAHSGNYSIALPVSGITLATSRYSGKEQKSFPYFDFNTNNEYIKHPQAVYPEGFRPSPGTYILNLWVKDNKPFDRSVVPVTVKLNATPLADLTVKAVVDGWKLLEGTLDIASTPSSDFNITITPVGGGVYVDDLRMHPKDAQMKTYAYDDKTLRLMAELDENDFATFYEYDNQGLLVRIKRETEKGVVTIKETRSSYLKKSL